MHLSVIIPAFNEAERISGTLQSVNKYLSVQDYDYEILVVNDGSKDETIKVAENLKIPNLKTIEYGENRGKGFAVKIGMLKAQGDLRIFIDADNSTAIEQIETFYPYLEQGYDLVIGSRYIKGAKILVHQPWHRRFLGRLGNLWIRLWAVPGVYDTQAGFKLFTARAAGIIFQRIRIKQWGFDFEALAIARAHRLRMKEVPIVWSDDRKSHVKMIAYFITLLDALRVRFNLIAGKYS